MENFQFKLTIFLVLFLFVIINVGAQEITSEDTYIINQYFQVNTLDNIKASETKWLNRRNINNNVIYNSEVDILQTGNYNNIEVKAKVKKLDVGQIGNSNNYEFISYYNTNKINFAAQQIGNNNQLQVFGQNSIINNMKVIQFSNNKTITIKNF